ncbi:MAG TPA: hypothetical protein VF747_16915, partial [Blastocatellia bacterium]
MAVTEIICGGVLLSAIGVIGVAISRPAQAEEETPGTASTLDDKTDSEAQLAALRSRNKVRLVENKEAGLGVAHLPCGVYGFSFSPQQESPLFERKLFRSFEVHKLADGTLHIIGFVTEKEHNRLALSNDHVGVKLYPEPYGEAVKAVSVPLDRAAHITGPSRDDG